MTSTTDKPAPPTLQETWAKYGADAAEIPERVAIRLCRSDRCRMPVWDGVTRAKGKPCAFDVRPETGEPLGTSHFRTCADRERFTKPKVRT